MGNDSGRRPARQDSPFREWLSDNLRYIMLIAVIAAIVLVALAVLGVFRENGDEPAGVLSAQASSEEGDASVRTIPEETEEPVSAPAEKAVTPSVTERPRTEAEAEAKAEPKAEEAQSGLAEAPKKVKSVIRKYFAALASADTEAVAAVTESISASDVSAISNGAYMRDYGDIEVWSYPGDAEGEYVALISYTYTYPGYQTRIPALTVLYMVEDGKGGYLVGSEATEERKAAAIDAALADEEVRALRDRISGQYDAALASDPALAQYIASLS